MLSETHISSPLALLICLLCLVSCWGVWEAIFGTLATSIKNLYFGQQGGLLMRLYSSLVAARKAFTRVVRVAQTNQHKSATRRNDMQVQAVAHRYSSRIPPIGGPGSRTFRPGKSNEQGPGLPAVKLCGAGATSGERQS